MTRDLIDICHLSEKDFRDEVRILWFSVTSRFISKSGVPFCKYLHLFYELFIILDESLNIFVKQYILFT